MKKKLAVIAAYLVVLLFVCAGKLISQQNDIKITRIGVDEGFPQLRVQSITQDSAGFIWIGTIDGLFRYDGYSFKAYRHNPFDSSSLFSANITQVHGDSHGLVWIMTSSGLNMFSTSLNKMQRFNELSPQTKQSEYFGRFYEDSQGRLWILTDRIFYYDRTEKTLKEPFPWANGKTFQKTRNRYSFFESKIKSNEFWIGTDSGLVQIQFDSKQTIWYHHINDDDSSVSETRIEKILEDNDGKIWVITKKGIDGFDRNSGKFRRYALPSELTSYLQEHSGLNAHFDASGNMWIWYIWSERGFVVFNPKTNSSMYVDKFSQNGFVESINSVNELMNSNSGDLWATSKNNGLYRRSFATGIWKHITQNEKYTDSLSGNECVLFQDRAGVLWVGTDGKGLNKIEAVKQKFQLYRNIQSLDGSFKVGDTRSIYSEKDGTAWIGLLSDGLLKLDLNSKQWERYLLHYDVGTIFPDPSDSAILWLGTWHEGLLKYNTNSSTFIQYKNDPDNKSTISDNHIRTVLKDHTGALWIGTWYSGVNLLLPSSQEFQRFTFDTTDQTSLSDNTVYCLYEDKAGTLWIGSQKGLNEYNRETQSYSRYLHDSRNPNSLRNDDIRSIVEDQAGNLWIGTNGGGLNKFDRDAGTFSAVTTENGLPNDNIYGILEDGTGNLWLSTNNGLCRYSPQTGECRNYDVRDGLQNNEFNTGAYFKNAHGELFFGGIDGFNVFHPDSIKDNSFIPPVYITDIKLYEKSIPSWGESLTLTYDQDFITFEFVALNFTEPERNQYMIKLDGLDGEWHNIGSRRYANYSHLSPGSYTFSVKGANNNGLWNPNATSITINILPPFWATWWFRTVSAIVLLVFGISVIRYYSTRKLKLQLAELERQAALDKERSRISQDMHDEIGTSLTKISILSELGLSKSSKDNTEQLKEISQTTETISEQMREIIWAMNPKNDTLDNLTAFIRRTAGDLFSVSSITYSIEYPEAIPPYYISSEFRRNIFLSVKEAMHNVIKHSRARDVMISLRIKGSLIEYCIKDTGMGFEHNMLTGFGNGLDGMTKRMKGIGGECIIESERGKGTSITLKVTLPI